MNMLWLSSLPPQPTLIERQKKPTSFMLMYLLKRYVLYKYTEGICESMQHAVLLYSTITLALCPPFSSALLCIKDKYTPLENCVSLLSKALRQHQSIKSFFFPCAVTTFVPVRSKKQYRRLFFLIRSTRLTTKRGLLLSIMTSIDIYRAFWCSTTTIMCVLLF